LEGGGTVSVLYLEGRKNKGEKGHVALEKEKGTRQCGLGRKEVVERPQEEGKGKRRESQPQLIRRKRIEGENKALKILLGQGCRPSCPAMKKNADFSKKIRLSSLSTLPAERKTKKPRLQEKQRKSETDAAFEKGKSPVRLYFFPQKREKLFVVSYRHGHGEERFEIKRESKEKKHTNRSFLGRKKKNLAAAGPCRREGEIASSSLVE